MMASLSVVTFETGAEAPKFAGVRVLEQVDVLAVVSAGDHVAIWREGRWDHCVMGRSREGSARCLQSSDGELGEWRLSEMCHKGAVVVLIEYEGGTEESLEQSYEWARDQIALTRGDTLQKRLLRCAGGVDFVVRSRGLRCADLR